MQDLKVALVQCQLAWENPADNRQQFEDLLAAQAAHADVVVLPEMFTTGFSMNAVANAEAPGGDTSAWMQSLAGQLDCAVTGSIAVREGDDVYNRMLFATPDAVDHYDKRHLFSMAGEHRRYRAGTDRVTVEWRDWRINLQVCYDLRFPVFCRNLGDFDLQLFVANWPDSRRVHWRQLLIARAIENQACVVGVNRVGSDANGLDYSGDSLAIAHDGAVLLDMQDRQGCETAEFSGEALLKYRERFPFLADADGFQLT